MDSAKFRSAARTPRQPQMRVRVIVRGMARQRSRDRTLPELEAKAQQAEIVRLLSARR